MKKIFLYLLCLQILTGVSFAQEKFDIITFTTPKGFQKEVKPNAVQFTAQNEADGSFALLTIFKSIAAGNDSKKNFDLSWRTVVKDNFEKVANVEISPTASENGWAIESGRAPYEHSGTKGVAMLVTATGGGKVVNLLILTNTQTFQSAITGFIGSIVLPKIEAPKTVTTPTTSGPVRSNFRFNTTNFDNGWTAVEEADWVRVTKGDITFLLHYPHTKERETFDNLEREARTFWDLLVAPRYSTLTNFEVLRSDRDFEPARFAAGNVTDKATGRKVYVALFSKQKRGRVEVIAPNKAEFAREFGSMDVNADIIDWKPLLTLFGYNRFAVDAADLQGKWSSSFSGTTQYVNIYTGSYAGAVTSVGASSYTFGAGYSYSYRVDGATSSGGRTAFSKAASSGKFIIPSNWQIHFSDHEGRPKTFPAHFSIIRGARILWIDGTAFGRIQ